MKKPRTINIGGKSFLRHRNKHGEVIVCVRADDENTDILSVGIAFCNPCDFNLRREVRHARGYGLASKRASLAPNASGSFLVRLKEDVIGVYDEEELSNVVEKLIIDLLRRESTCVDNFGFPQYEGKGKGEFEKWVVPFCEELQ